MLTTKNPAKKEKKEIQDTVQIDRSQIIGGDGMGEPSWGDWPLRVTGPSSPW